MNPKARVPKWFPPLSLATCAVMIALGSFVWHFVPLRVTGQAFLLVMILHAFCYWPPMVRLVAAMPVLHRIVFGVLLGAMIMGHYSLNGRSYFPFVTWEIFPMVDSDDPVTCNEFIATTMDGRKVRLLVEQLFPSIVQIVPVCALDDTRYYSGGHHRAPRPRAGQGLQRASPRQPRFPRRPDAPGRATSSARERIARPPLMRAAETLRHLIGPIELLHEKAGPGLLRLARLGIFALWIFKLLLDPLWRLAEMPREMFDPLGILTLLPTTATIDNLLTPTGLTALLVVTLIVLVVCLTNRAFAFVATLAAILLTVYSSLIRSFGPAVHTDIVLLLAVYALAGFAWADYCSSHEWERRLPAHRRS